MKTEYTYADYRQFKEQSDKSKRELLAFLVITIAMFALSGL